MKKYILKDLSCTKDRWHRLLELDPAILQYANLSPKKLRVSYKMRVLAAHTTQGQSLFSTVFSKTKLYVAQQCLLEINTHHRQPWCDWKNIQTYYARCSGNSISSTELLGNGVIATEFLMRNENDKMVHLKLEELEGNYGSVRNIISVTGGQSENTLEIIEDVDVCWMFHKLHADKDDDDDDDVHFRTSTMPDHK